MKHSIKSMIAVLIIAAALFGQNPAEPTSGSIAGRVLLTDGTPAYWQKVSLLAAPRNDAAMSVSDRGAALIQNVKTDTQGRYRFEGVPPGRYYVVLGQLRMPTFFPGTDKQASASVVSLERGASVSGIDFTVQSPLEVTVSGHVIRKSPGPVGGNFGGLVLILSANDEVSGEVFAVEVAGDGSFTIPGVEAGVYELSVSKAPADSTLTVVVGKQDINDLSVPVLVDTTINGRVVLEDGGAADLRFRLRAQRVVNAAGPTPLTPGTVTPSTARYASNYDLPVDTKASGAFQATVPEGSYHIAVLGIPAGFHLKSATYGGVDLRKGPVTITPTVADELHVTLGRGPAPEQSS